MAGVCEMVWTDDQDQDDTKALLRIWADKECKGKKKVELWLSIWGTAGVSFMYVTLTHSMLFFFVQLSFFFSVD